MAIPAGQRLNQYTGKWYTDEEAAKVQKDLIENEWTGVSWRWVDQSGYTVTGTLY